MRSEAETLRRLFTIREYYKSEWVSREIAEPSVNELLWSLGYEELSGGAFLDEEEVFHEVSGVRVYL